MNWLDKTYGHKIAISTTYGYITKEHRFESGITKTHNNDAFIVACGSGEVAHIKLLILEKLFCRFKKM